MAIFRSVQIAFWTDTKVNDDYSPEDKLLYLYLLTNPHTNLCGCYEISISQMAAEIGYKSDTIKRLIEKAQTKFQSVVYAEDTKEILLLNWYKYNWTSSEKFRKPLMKEIMAVKNVSFRTYLMKIFEGEDTVSIPYLTLEGYGIDTTVTVTDTVTDKEIKHQYGEYKNVLLTDAELDKLKSEFPEDWADRIENLSFYLKSKGVSYKSHLATIRNWARKERVEPKTPKRTKFVNYEQRTVDYDKMIMDGGFS